MRRILCFGDSLTAGYTASDGLFTPYSTALAAALQIASNSPVHVRSIGFSCCTTEDLLDNASEIRHAEISGELLPGLELAMQDSKWDLVVLLAGTNDIGGLVDLRDDSKQLETGANAILANLQQLHAIVHRHGVASVALSIPPSKFVKMVSALDACRKRVNAGMKDFSGDVKYIEFPLSCTEDEIDAGYWDEDGLHFTAKGYQEIGQRLARAGF